MRLWQKIVALIASIVFVAGVIGILYTLLVAHNPHLLFQPEGAMLDSATNPGSSLGQSNDLGNASTTLPYPYQATICANSTGDTAQYNCLQTYYQNLVTKYGVDVAFVDLKKRYAQNTFVAAQCHPLAHAIGRVAATLYPTISEAYDHGDSFCWSGYYHGVLEAVVEKIGEANLPKQINTICADVPGKSTYDFEYYNCVHGLGHGIMEINDDDVFKSLKVCDNLTGDWEQESCYSGVFMENIINYDHGEDAPDLKATDPLYPCTAVDEKYKSQCYLGQTSFVLSQNKGDFLRTFQLCSGVAEPYRDICDQSLGRDAANYAAHNGPMTENYCMLGVTDADTNNCIIGAVKEFISYYHAIDQANAYCNLYSDPEKSVCLATGKQYFAIF